MHLTYVAILQDASERNDLVPGVVMPILTRREPLTEYVLRDSAGMVVGTVLAPPGGLRTGPGAETVLMVRCPAATRRMPVRTAA
jgi:hypothetical protein